jgi:L-aspartate oxidase
MENERFDVVIVGTGIAGLATALFLDPRMKILMITKSLTQSCNTIRAEGGVAAAMGPTTPLSSTFWIPSGQAKN